MGKTIISYCFLFALLLALAGCESDSQPGEEPSVPAAPIVEQPAERELKAIARVDTYRTQVFYTVTFDPEVTDLRMFNSADKGIHTFETVSAIADSLGLSVQLLMNGGMYQRDRSAQGLLILEGQTIQPIDTQTNGYGNFYLQPNGVFAIDTTGKALLLTPQEFADSVDEEVIRYATQSGPMLLVEGEPNPLFSDPSPNRHIRNGVGLTPEGKVVFAISEQPVTFYNLASLFRMKGCNQALYLDGFVSRMYVPELGIGALSDGADLGPLIAIFQEADSTMGP